MDNWDTLISSALCQARTPAYLFSEQILHDAYNQLAALSCHLPVRHWFSFKTCPVPPVLESWATLGEGIEVVSDFELRAALGLGIHPGRILVNGVAKHGWLSAIDVDGLWVHVDSEIESRELAPIAPRRRWHVGLRIHPTNECDPDDARFGGQFGLTPDEAVKSVAELRRNGVEVESIHFHLGGNIGTVDEYRKALHEVAHVCSALNIAPRIVDIGGGLPVVGEINPLTGQPTWTIQLEDFRAFLHEIPGLLPSTQELWLENGKFMTARAAVLLITVCDVKHRDECRYVICDGGRTNHALVSDWQQHEVRIIPQRTGRRILTTICGPTCMPFDWLVRQPLPDDIQIGDVVVWMNAGAYHIPWETRFSHGLAEVLWVPKTGAIRRVRSRESFDEWWGIWQERI